MRKALACCIVFVVLCLVIPSQSFAHGEFTNDSGKPVRILDLNDSEGKPFATLFMTGKEMTTNHFNYPEAGAGYYEAVKGREYFIPFATDVIGGLRVDRVEWDGAGKIIAVKGLRPFFDGAKKIKITSDVTHPKIKDGVLYLKLEGKGDKEFQFEIIFGIGISITPSFY